MLVGIKENILGYYKEIENDPHGRYRSWEHCYSFFQESHDARNDKSRDEATLHLAFYLASWGMYRPSSRLLQKDFRVHYPIVEEILDNKYSELWKLDFFENRITDPELDLIFQLVHSISQLYREQQISPTATLVTKILLGTLGCVTAYDELFIMGVTYWNQRLPAEYKPKFPARFSKVSFRGVSDFCRENIDELRQAQAYIGQHGITYPAMKLADMYFWSLGYQIGR
ncbi:MAG: hypothetical protein KA746_16695 [Pyrinomonadaceae bacterium]|nr:hypothetical protein [Pyrinomonadaceae bacterium]